MHARRLSIALALAAATLAYSPAFADAGYPTDAELKALPKYCTARLRDLSGPSGAHWKKVFGYKSWTHMHHYCQGQNILNRARRQGDPQARSKMFRDAMDTLTGFLEQSPDDFVLRYEVYYHIGRAASETNNPGLAIKSLTRSIALEPRFLRPYRLLSDVYKEFGQYEDALSVVKAGLEVSPKSASLRRRKRALDKLLEDGAGEPTSSSASGAG